MIGSFHVQVVYGRYWGIDGLWGIVRYTALLWIKTRSYMFPITCNHTDFIIESVPVRMYTSSEPQINGLQRGIIYLHDGGFAAFNVGKFTEFYSIMLSDKIVSVREN